MSAGLLSAAQTGSSCGVRFPPLRSPCTAPPVHCAGLCSVSPSSDCSRVRHSSTLCCHVQLVYTSHVCAVRCITSPSLKQNRCGAGDSLLQGRLPAGSTDEAVLCPNLSQQIDLIDGCLQALPMPSRWVSKHTAHALSIVLQKHHAVTKPSL